MNGSVVVVSVVVAVLTVVAVVFACVWLRPRVAKHRPYALALAAPIVPLAAAGVVLIAVGSAFATVPVGCGVLLCMAAAWAFWPHEPVWNRFEQAFWTHVARHQEHNVGDSA